MLRSLSSIRRCPAPVYTVAVSTDGSRCLWAGGEPEEDCSIAVCDVAANKVLHRLGAHRRPVVRARFLEDNSIISFSFDSHVCRWTPTGELAASNETHLAHRADAFAVSTDGKLAVIGDIRGEISGWRVENGSRCFAFKENNRRLQVWAVALEPSGRRLLTGGAEGRIRLWTLDAQRRELEIDLGWGHHIKGLAWHPDGATFVAAVAPDGGAPDGSKSRVMVFDGESGRELASLFPDGHQPLCCTLNRDGRIIAAAGGWNDRGGRASKANCVIHLWNTQSRQAIASMVGHSDLVRDLAFSPDSRWLLSAGWDNTVRSWCLDQA